MIERSMQRFDLYPAKLMGDSAYGSAEMLRWLVCGGRSVQRNKRVRVALLSRRSSPALRFQQRSHRFISANTISLMAQSGARSRILCCRIHIDFAVASSGYPWPEVR
jgi:hypothetical protein